MIGTFDGVLVAPNQSVVGSRIEPDVVSLKKRNRSEKKKTEGTVNRVEPVMRSGPFFLPGPTIYPAPSQPPC